MLMSHTGVSKDRIDALTHREIALFVEAHPKCRQASENADKLLMFGVPMVWHIANPGHEQVAPGAAVLQNVTPEFGGHRREHRNLCRSKRVCEPLVSLDVQHGNVKIRLRLDIKAA